MKNKPKTEIAKKIPFYVLWQTCYNLPGQRKEEKNNFTKLSIHFIPIQCRRDQCCFPVPRASQVVERVKEETGGENNRAIESFIMPYQMRASGREKGGGSQRPLDKEVCVWDPPEGLIQRRYSLSTHARTGLPHAPLLVHVTHPPLPPPLPQPASPSPPAPSPAQATVIRASRREGWGLYTRAVRTLG